MSPKKEWNGDYQLLAVWPGTSSLAFLGHNFCIYQMRNITAKAPFYLDDIILSPEQPLKQMLELTVFVDDEEDLAQKESGPPQSYTNEPRFFTTSSHFPHCLHPACGMLCGGSKTGMAH
jgi:hypothetical protein